MSPEGDESYTPRVFFSNERDLYNTLVKYEINGLLGFIVGLGSQLTKDQLHNIYMVSSECLEKYVEDIISGEFREKEEYLALVSAASLLGAKYCYNLKSARTEEKVVEYLEPLVDEYVDEHNEKIAREIEKHKKRNPEVARFLEEHLGGFLTRERVLAGVLHPQVDLENEYRALKKRGEYNREEIEHNKKVYASIRDSFLRYVERNRPGETDRVKEYIREIEVDAKRQDEHNNPRIWENVTLVIDAMVPPEIHTKEQLLLHPKIRRFLGFESPIEYVRNHLDVLVSSPSVTLFLGYYFENHGSVREGIEKLARIVGYDGDIESIVSLFENKISRDSREITEPILARYGIK